MAQFEINLDRGDPGFDSRGREWFHSYVKRLGAADAVLGWDEATVGGGAGGRGRSRHGGPAVRAAGHLSRGPDGGAGGGSRSTRSAAT